MFYFNCGTPLNEEVKFCTQCGVQVGGGTTMTLKAQMANRDAYNEQGDCDQAIADCTSAITLNPNYANAYASRGMAYHGQGKTDLAIQDLEKSVSLDPNYQLAKDRLNEVRAQKAQAKGRRR